MKVGNNYHLAYCANVHPGESWEEAFGQLKKYLPEIKKAVSPQEPFGLGLYLSNKASNEILVGSRLSEFKEWLGTEGLYVFTMNGFPYGDFHGSIVKDNVYKPDWTSLERVEYTKRLFNILAELLPEGMDGGISTLPVSYKYWFPNHYERDKVTEIASKHLSEMAMFLGELSAKSQKYFHLDIEPEPDCILENTEEVIDFFKRLKNSSNGNQDLVEKHISLCFDICHFSVEFEEPDTALARLVANGVQVGKIQISSALRAKFNNSDGREFNQFDETRYLHQTVKKTSEGDLMRFRDLSFAISDNAEVEEWRTHFHVPLFISKYGRLQSTQDNVIKVLDFLKKNHITNHLEVETYTWDVLPAEIKIGLTESIIRELEWVKKKISD